MKKGSTYMTRRQQIVKNIAIVFLSILLILTFFSNTIMNITLPEVMVGEISRGIITTQITASGIAEAHDVYQVIMTESRVVESIPVIEGQAVKEGEVLFYLEGEESYELESVVKQRDALQLEYNTMILKNNITAIELQNLTNSGITLEHCMNVLAGIKDEAKYQEALERHILYMELYEKYKELKSLEEQIKQYETDAMGSEVLAPISGTIVEVEVVSGKRAERDTLALTILPEGQKLYMELSLPAEDADMITKTTQIEVTSPTSLKNTHFVLQDVVLDPSSSEGNKIVTFEVQGENVIVGQYFSIVINKKSEQYEMLVSNNAIRKDSNGTYYVLKLIQESSSLGNRYYVEKVEVELLAESDMQKAISGALYGDEYLIIDSNAPVTDGQQVRLVEQ